jgi:hypothetical protein
VGNIINKNGAINAVEFNEVAVISAKHSITKDDKIISSKFVEIPVIDGLVGYYPSNGNANDYSGSGYNGTVNGAVISTNRFGENGSYSFDGVDDYINLNRNLLTYPENFTISLWVKNDENGAEGNVRIYDGGADVVSGYGFNIRGVEIPQSELYGFSIRTTDNDLKQINFTLQDLTWTNIVCIKNGIIMQLYINGGYIGQETLTQSEYRQSDMTYIGGNGTSASFKGIIDDVRIYDRALTEKEIALLFDYGKIKLEKNGLFYTKEIEEI